MLLLNRAAVSIPLSNAQDLLLLRVTGSIAIHGFAQREFQGPVAMTGCVSVCCHKDAASLPAASVPVVIKAGS